MPRRLWYFVHVPKTAGTTVRHYLHDAFAPDEVLFVYPGAIDREDAHVLPFEQAASLPHDRLTAYRVLYGHYLFRPEWLVHEDCRGLAFVRDPVARVVSWFNYIKAQTPGAGTDRVSDYARRIAADDLNLEDLFGAVGGIPELDNGIVRYLGGAAGLPIGAVTREHVANACANVERYFDFVGHTTWFDESMRRIAEVLGRPWRPRAAANRSAAGRAESLVDQHDPAFLERLTTHDRAFVDWIEARWFAGARR